MRSARPCRALGLSQADLTAPEMVFQMGEPPRRIDVLTSITGVDFGEAWAARSIHRVGEIDVPFLAGPAGTGPKARDLFLPR